MARRTPPGRNQSRDSARRGKKNAPAGEATGSLTAANLPRSFAAR